jgi:magnesium chelatase family protein
VHATVRSAALVGGDVIEVSVEATLAGGLPAVHVVGLPDAAVREAKERVRAALRAVGAALPPSRVIVNLAPADVRKEGPAFDLPIALALLAAQQRVPTRRLAGATVVGELGLDGAVRPVRGALAVAVHAATRDGATVVLPLAQAGHAARVPGLAVVGVADLGEAMGWARGTTPSTSFASAASDAASPTAVPGPDLAEVRGQAAAKRALEVVAAGAHHLLLIGPPGGGKTLLARCLPSLLPPLDDASALEVARLHSLTSYPRDPADRRPPFREPHHVSSPAGVIGGAGGPGDLSLAHRGVLFLDELPEFDRRVLEALRQPLESGALVLARAGARARYPAAVQLVAAMNPCPCGFDGDLERPCSCDPRQRRRYRARVSGPLLDRFDLRLLVPRLGDAADAAEVDGGVTNAGRTDARSERSAPVAARVERARRHALERQGAANATLRGAPLRRVAALTADARALLAGARRHGGLSERGADAVTRVARTIADLQERERVDADHLAEALAYRVDASREATA